jgi:hypothetical protein
VCLKMLLVKLLPLKTKLPMMLRNVFVVWMQSWSNGNIN